MPLSDSTVIAIIGEELSHCDNSVTGTYESYHSRRRARNLALYFGEPLGNEVEGQSSWVSRDTLEAVEAAMPEIMRAFSDANQSVAFIPADDSIEAEKAAADETDAVRHVFFQRNAGFLNLYEWVKTALVESNGYMRCEGATYTRYRTRELVLTPDEFDALNNDPDWELKGKPKLFINGEEVKDPENTELTLGVDIVSIKATFRESTESDRIDIEGVAPENMFVTLSHRSIDLEDCQFVAERMIMTPTDLKRMGVSDDKIESIPDYTHLWTEGEAARHQESAVFGKRVSSDKSTREKEVFRCFIEMDYDENGEAERYEVWIGGENVLLPINPVDNHPYFSITPNIIPFRHQGQGYPDLLDHVTHMKSAIIRGIANAIYHTSNPRPVINVGMTTDTTEDDVATNIPGYQIRVDGVPSQAIDYQKHDALPNDAFGLVDYLDGTKEDMIGHGQQTSLDPNQIAQANTGVVWAALEAKKGKIELVARLMAQVGLRAVFLRIHQLLRESRRGFMARIGGKMARVHPSQWIMRDDVEIMVGLGTTNRDKQAAGAQAIMQTQKGMVMAGGLGTMVDMVGIYNAASKEVEAYEMGAPENYYVDPLKAAAGELNEERLKLIEQVKQGQNKPSEAETLANATKEIEMLKAQVKIKEAQLKDRQFQFSKLLDVRKQQASEIEAGMKHAEAMTKLDLEHPEEEDVPGSLV